MSTLFKSPRVPSIPATPYQPTKKDMEEKAQRRRIIGNKTVKTSPLGIVDFATNSVKTKLGQ